jgi:hypothetical protein
VSTSDVSFRRVSLDDVLAVRPQIEAALAYGNGCYTFDDVAMLLLAGRFQMWRRGGSIVLTELQTFPRKRICVAFLAAGKQDELAALVPGIEQWAIGQGCTEGWLTGRKGWARSFLTKQDGWTWDEKITLYRPLKAAQ